MLTERKALSVLRKQGYKITTQRCSVLKALFSCKEHLTANAIYNRAKRDDPKIGLVTVYRILDLFNNLGIICEVRTSGNSHSYLLSRPLEHHHHLVCNGCGVVSDFSDCGLDQLTERLSRKTGYEIEDHVLEFRGYCQECTSSRLSGIRTTAR